MDKKPIGPAVFTPPPHTRPNEIFSARGMYARRLRAAKFIIWVTVTWQLSNIDCRRRRRRRGALASGSIVFFSLRRSRVGGR